MSQQNTVELAKQGDPQAIAALINRNLQPKSVTAKVNLKDDYLQVLLESSQVPNQQDLVAFIRKGITELGAPCIRRIKVYGSQQGESFPAWDEEFELIATVTSPSPVPQRNPLQISALKSCPDCSYKVSRTAVNCPNCGATLLLLSRFRIWFGRLSPAQRALVCAASLTGLIVVSLVHEGTEYARQTEENIQELDSLIE